jgi:hypothetical protein
MLARKLEHTLGHERANVFINFSTLIVSSGQWNGMTGQRDRRARLQSRQR